MPRRRSNTIVVVPAAVPSATVTCVSSAPFARTRAVRVQPNEVPVASVLAVRLARADAEAVARLQAEGEALRAQVAQAS